MVKIHYLIIFLLLGCCVECSKPVPFSWYQLEPGLYLGKFDAPIPARLGDSKITVLRINPKYFEANIYTASQFDQQRRTAKQWCDKLDLVAAINAGMYATDNLTAVGFLKTGDHVNNPSFHKKHNSVFACQPKDKSVPPFQIIDIQYQNFKELKKKYNSFVQSIRMISTKQKNVWEKQPNAWSIAALGVNKNGELLFIFSESPYSVHVFANMILKLPLSIYNAMYLEGGPEASLYIHAGNTEKELSGMIDPGFLINEGQIKSWPIPNIIGIRRKKK